MQWSILIGSQRVESQRKGREMRTFIGIIVGIVLFLVGPTFAGAQDSTAINLGKGWTFRMDYIPFGVNMRASEESGAQVVAEPFIGSGISLTLKRNDTYGVNGSVLFYKGEGGIYPIVGTGPIIFPSNRLAILFGWDFGNVGGGNTYKERLRLLLNYNLNIVGN